MSCVINTNSKYYCLTFKDWLKPVLYLNEHLKFFPVWGLPSILLWMRILISITNLPSPPTGLKLHFLFLMYLSVEIIVITVGNMNLAACQAEEIHKQNIKKTTAKKTKTKNKRIYSFDVVKVIGKNIITLQKCISFLSYTWKFSPWKKP